MTAAHETPYHLTYTDSSITSPIQRPEHGFYSSEASCEQPHNRQVEAQERDTGRTHAFHSNKRHIAISVSPESDVLLPADVEYSRTSTPLQPERSSAYITDSSINERIQCNDSQDKRPEAVSHIPFISRDINSDTPVDTVSSLKSDFCPGKDCPTRRDILTSRITWLNGTIVLICSVSTALSALFVVLASKGQRYGDYIGNSPKASLSISAAILWTSVVAKTIEISFVTGFVAFLGQVLTRKAFDTSSGRGVTLSELTMWRWVVQPGTLVTQSEIARYAGLSTLGVLTLLSTVLSTLYVTAATALVQPISKQSDWHTKTMIGSVQTQFANIEYIQSLCKIPIPDKANGAASCMQVENGGKNSYNLIQFLAKWNDMVGAGQNVSTNQVDRPAWIGLTNSNTTFIPEWIHAVDTAAVSREFGRVVNNVSLALPHIGVSSATRDTRNYMPRSDTSDSIEAYSLWASVPSPVIKVLCVQMNKTELEPIVYDTWNNETVDMLSWISPGIRDNATAWNKTAVDDLFGWSTEDEYNTVKYPPVFPKYPLPFNTIVNDTSFAQGRTAIYLLGQGGPMDGGDLTGQYSLCKLEVDISNRCSTLHSVTVSGSKVESLCEERAQDMAYYKTHPNSRTIRGVPNWRDVGAEWAYSLSLGTGVMDAYASQSRILMMLSLQPENLDPEAFKVELSQSLPSLAETLAVTASDTLLSSLQVAPFVEEWVSLPGYRCLGKLSARHNRQY
jgi:hypothetical protein